MGRQSDSLDFFAQIRDLIAAGEELIALSRLRSLLEASDRDLYREALVQISRYNDVRKRERRGVLSQSESAVEGARIRAAVLEFVDDIEQRIDRRLLPIPTHPIDLTPPDSSSLEKIIGASHLQNIAWLRIGLARSKAVCRVVTPQGYGTGFLISGSRIMTNHHVISDAAVAAMSCVEFGFEADEAGQLQTPLEYRLIPESVRADKKLDYCVVDVALNTSSAEALDRWGALEFSRNDVPSVGEHVTIIQHPSGGPKQIALTANQVVNIFEHRLQYTTDTLPGSSGSPVFNDNWKVVALHHAGGNIVKNVIGETHFANEGILLDSILTQLGE